MPFLQSLGGGKSTLIKRIAVAYAYPDRRKLVDDDLPDKEWFPIFIRCRELGDKVTSSISEIISNIPIRAEISNYQSEFSLIVSDILQKGNALLLIDGLDEIADERSRITFVNQLRTFLATYPHTSIITTSRAAGFRAISGVLSTYCKQFKISNLNNDEISVLCTRWHIAIIDNSENTKKEALSLARFIISDNRIRALAENPLLLTTLLFVKRWAGYLPTKKSILYQEMIKLLLVTWNVEGHTQLDIEEAEPQLAYIAFVMTVKKTQTITFEDLKESLLNARKEMPEILSYTNLSVPEFIRRVESRSSILIMTGHKLLENGHLTPIYEFLHLSFQEYLCAKAIVDKYIPLVEAQYESIEIIKPHFKDENWKEIIPLIAVLSKREAKILLEFLIQELNINYESHNRIKRYSQIKRYMYHDVLGNCLASEVQIYPELLEKALICYAKYRDTKYIDIIMNNKFGNIFKNLVETYFYNSFSSDFAFEFGSIIASMRLNSIEISDTLQLIQNLKEDLFSDEKTKACTSILVFMELFYGFNSRSRMKYKSPKNLDLSVIFDQFLNLIKKNDIHYNFAICWCLAWISENKMLNYPPSCRQ